MNKKSKVPPKPVKSKGGRPSKFDKIDLEQCKKLYLMGHTDYEVASFFNINQDTLHTWKIVHPEFSESIKDWKKAADERVERSLFERAVGYTHKSEQVFCYLGKIKRASTIKHYPPSDIACFYWLNNRKRAEWNQKPDESTDPRLLDMELVFKGVPDKGKLDPSRMKYLQN